MRGDAFDVDTQRDSRVENARAIDVNGLTPTVAATYKASELTAALDHLARGAFGKIVVTF